MYDIKLNESFSLRSSTVTNSHWYGGEPVRDILHAIFYFLFFTSGTDLSLLIKCPSRKRIWCILTLKSDMVAHYHPILLAHQHCQPLSRG